MNRIIWLTRSTINLQRSLASIEPLLRNNEFATNSTNLRTFKTLNNLQQQEKSTHSNEKTNTTQKKAKQSPKITLIAQNHGISVTTLEEAHKLAKRRELHLTLVTEMDTKTQRAVYKLVTPAEFLAEELNDLKADERNAVGKNATKKSEKTLTIGSRISEHDLASRQKNICKWLAKQHEVRILIQGGADDMPKMEQICKAIEQSIKEPELIGKIQQKRSKGSHIKFNIVPIAVVKTDEAATKSVGAGTIKGTPIAA